MIGRIEETSASFEARSAPRSYPMSPTPPAQKLHVSPTLITEKGTLTFSHEKDGKIRLVYGNWDDAKVVEPSELLEPTREFAGGGGADLTPPRGSADPP